MEWTSGLVKFQIILDVRYDVCFILKRKQKKEES